MQTLQLTQLKNISEVITGRDYSDSCKEEIINNVPTIQLLSLYNINNILNKNYCECKINAWKNTPIIWTTEKIILNYNIEEFIKNDKIIITMPLFYIITGKLPINREIIEEYLTIFIEKSKIQKWLMIFSMPENTGITYSPDGEYVEKIQIIPHIMVVSKESFIQRTLVIPKFRSDIKKHAHKFLDQALAKNMSTLRFELIDGKYISISVNKIILDM